MEEQGSQHFEDGKKANLWELESFQINKLDPFRSNVHLF